MLLEVASLHSYISPYIRIIDNELSKIISGEFINHIAQRVCFGGKRIRPIILILISRMLGGMHENIFLNSAISVELIHLASLLHDDVIDQSNSRHGKDAAHILFGNQQVILAGDFLFAESFQKIVKTENVEVIKILSNVSSILASGELYQLQTKIDNSISAEKYFDIIYKKTASLFEASAGIASIIQNKKSEEVFEFGKNIGMTFQIIDDILDYTSKKTGKKDGVDFFEGKVTLPIILASKDDNAKEQLNILFKKEDKNQEDWNQVKNLLEKSGALTYCKEIAISYANKAKAFLQTISPSKESVIMLDIIDFFINREI